MPSRTALRIAFFLGACGALPACGRHTERDSAVATSPNGRWHRAFVKVEYSPSFSKNGRSHPAGVIHHLVLGNNEVSEIIADAYEARVSPQRFAQLRAMEYTVRFAPDGESVAVSNDGAHTWTLFELGFVQSGVDHPFWCAHRTFTTLDPWPSSRDLALEILAAANPDSSAARVHRVMPGSDWALEATGATLYACQHTDDPSLRAALVDAYLQPGYEQLNGPPGLAVTQCVGRLASADPALQLRLQSAASNREPLLRARIAMARLFGDAGAPTPSAPSSTTP